jgi:hypothetical protein
MQWCVCVCDVTLSVAEPCLQLLSVLAVCSVWFWLCCRRCWVVVAATNGITGVSLPAWQYQAGSLLTCS